MIYRLHKEIVSEPALTQLHNEPKNGQSGWPPLWNFLAKRMTREEAV